MKIFIFFLLLPFFPFCQTVHIADGKIEYKGKEKIEGLSETEILSRAQTSVISSLKNYQELKEDSNKNAVKARGEIKLNSSYNHIRKVLYSITITANGGGYQYHIDSVYLKQKIRGGKTEIRSSKELLEGMEEAGIQVMILEKILNEIDMRFQHLIAMLEFKIKTGEELSQRKPSTRKGRK